MHKLALVLPFAGLLICIGYAAEPMKAAADPIEGIYSVAGDGGNYSYTGTTIIRKRGDGYVIQSQTTSFDEDGAILGVGFTVGPATRTGDTLSFAWKFGDKVTGLTVYKVKGNALEGKWVAFPGDGEYRDESLKRIGPLPELKPRGSTSARQSFCAVPMRDGPQMQDDTPAPLDISGDWNGYTFTQYGVTVVMDHERWPATARFDGVTLIVMWHSPLEQDWLYIGVYTFNGVDFAGCWGRSDQTEIKDGALQGVTHPETLRRPNSD